jgi:hypothetical protein
MLSLTQAPKLKQDAKQSQHDAVVSVFPPFGFLFSFSFNASLPAWYSNAGLPACGYAG